ncbi:NAD(P)-dependent iron-only hydrogenase diaphorase component flavoprotein [Syntrophobotulus glycolicus DSM 8271]|uniref:NAD(P)-dependent iron-only hydrogenase diaphorase component flavoprotein n=1 Tax=Syntrophobotulus glycolicus (strain DSM 8271 / FlGlyR) TaxID=645991 RepID=F0SX99_SYNGF|nr:NADH-quinone oxidoreductase subunit NuoF [Syntrophobotulus glycolicus]ADY56959.1 NAD(P)-dependent iron-only hydrogenase diaphorase component flavoprotein [Syntrophobotulus glycolicus DSM 8271]
MEALSHHCCEKCGHSVQAPCNQYVRCRTEGPLCHDDEICRSERARLLAKMTNPRGGGMRQVLICTGTGCASSGSNRLIDLIREELAAQGLDEHIQVRSTGCHGFCEQGPILIIEPDKTFYTKVKPSDIPEIVARDIVGGEKIERLLFKDPLSGETASTYESVNFYAKQNRVILKKCGLIDPERVSQYFAHQGYRALEKVLQKMKPEEVIEEVKQSGLRGRGGAGFPTGLKWSFCRAAEGDKKYLICNADEGDPGAFMDRSVLEGDPHAVIEGMLIGAYAIGAAEGYIYCRAEYPLAVERLKTAIGQAEKYGLLGKNILNSGFHFKLRIKEGAGAFVCGEETALIASIEGQRGMPRVRPPYPAVKGLWGKPTNINNVETWANVPHIILNGAGWYSQFGTEKSKGTKIFAMTGKVNNTGLVEVPMGITLREIIFDIGGGIKGGKKFKAAQIGGPSGGCLPESMLDIPVDFDSLGAVGAMVGSGGLTILDETTCMVDMARYFLNFTQNESCGKCTPCREGTKRMLEILVRITKGEGKEGDLENLERLAGVIRKTSLCGLGQTAPNPVSATIKYFRPEYEAHIKEKRCPAHVCTTLLKYSIDHEKCKRCGLCAKHCPAGCIFGDKNTPYEIETENCIQCQTCLERCKFGAVTVS